MVREVRAAIGERSRCAWTPTTPGPCRLRARCCGGSRRTTSAASRSPSARTRSSRGCAVHGHRVLGARADLRRAVALGVPDFYVLNLVELGGIRRTVEFVRACEQFGIGFWFHSGDTGVASAAYLQVSRALEPIREPSQALFHWYGDDVIAEGPFCPGAASCRPGGPGLGVTLDPAALALPRALPRRGRVPLEEACAERTRGSFGAADGGLEAGGVPCDVAVG